MARAAAGGFALPAGSAAELDRLLMQAERTLTRPEGLPRRPWNRHQIYGEVFFTGKGASLPGVREALERRDWDEASAQIAAAAGVLEDFARQVNRAAAVLQRGARASHSPP
jgi:N-acetylated-alpha-linked acidic dipeptidase